MISNVSVLTAETATFSGQQGTETQRSIRCERMDHHEIFCFEPSPVPALTCGIVDNLSMRAAPSFIERQHRHQVRVATQALVGAVVAGGVAVFLATITCLNEGFIFVCIRYSVPRQSAVSI